MLSDGRVAEFFKGPSFNLTNAFFGHSKSGANLFQGLRFVDVIEAISSDNNCLFTTVELIEELSDLLGASFSARRN